MYFHGKKKKFIELVERVMVRWGYTNTEGKIYGILLVSEKTLTIMDLLKLTDLSRTSISISLKRLVRDDLVTVRREKKIKYFSPNPIFTEKFMEQPRELLNKEIIPLIGIVEDLLTKATSEEHRRKLERMKDNLKNLEDVLKMFVRAEEKNIKT